jgi:hypothetical protein
MRRERLEMVARASMVMASASASSRAGITAAVESLTG